MSANSTGVQQDWLALQNIAFEFREWGTWIGLGPTSSSSNLVNSARLCTCADLAWAKYCTGAGTAWAAFAGGTFWREWKNTKLDKRGKQVGEIEDYSVKNSTMQSAWEQASWEQTVACEMLCYDRELKKKLLLTFQVNDWSASMRKWALGWP